MPDSRLVSRVAAAIAVGGGLALAACEKPEPAVAPPAAKPADSAASQALVAEAKAYYDAKCVDCHGSRGAGNGIKSDTLVPPPRNFQDPEWQASMKNADIERIIVEGGLAVGKSDAMPAHADLADRPELVTAIQKYVRTFDD